MAAPEFVPLKPTAEPRSYKSPPRRPESWRAERPGEVVATGQPRADRLGNQGPDQGYVWRLAHQFEGTLSLVGDEREDDALAGAVTVALKRASLFGRAPVVHDLTVGLTVWGFLDATPDADLVAVRGPLFAEARNAHHYDEQRVIADAVPEATLRKAHAAVATEHAADWRRLLDLPA